MTEAGRNDGSKERLEAAQFEKLRLENEKLRLELEALRKGQGLRLIMPFTPLITILVAVAGFAFGIYQYRAQQQANRTAMAAQSKKDTDAAQREFMKPLLQNQLSLYLQAASAAATISSSTDPAEKKKAMNDFWRLYEGPLIMVESKEVSGAMVDLGKCLDGSESCTDAEISKRSHALASRMQESILKSWNTNPENFASDKFSYR